jgi:hypothetical protein
MPENAKRYRSKLAQGLRVSAPGVLAALLELHRLPIAKADETARKALALELRTIYKQAQALDRRVRKAARTLEGLSLDQTWMPERKSE